MKTITTRELLHHFAHYLKDVKAGERIVVLERRTPVADIIPHDEHIEYAGWKREIAKIKGRGETFAQTAQKLRAQDR